ncbi:hypothetical protein LAY41_24290 [Argonema galeatum A003/A1]|nr:hypothetical protein [Argonema galeatum]MCL1467510.1 hypothetical protein [Argonema galeatum A003/A1]
MLLLFTLSFAVALPAEASFCRNTNDRTICIISINRSAKNYWEYRASVSVDGVARPIEVYNCRDRIKIRKDGTIVPFQSSSPGKLICSFLKK